MVSLMTVYDAFLSKVKEDEWARCCSESDLQCYMKDWRSLLNSSLPYFKFPRCQLTIDEEKAVFIDNEMGDTEVEILAVYMKQEWLKRTVDSWENIKTQYSESDFSQANLLNTFINLREQVKEEAKQLERIYYRSVNRRPFKYGKLAGGKSRAKR